jgi:hypothetical protein
MYSDYSINYQGRNKLPGIHWEKPYVMPLADDNVRELGFRVRGQLSFVPYTIDGR